MLKALTVKRFFINVAFSVRPSKLVKFAIKLFHVNLNQKITAVEDNW